MSPAVSRVPAGRRWIDVPCASYAQPLAGTTCGASSRCTRCVSTAFDGSSIAAAVRRLVHHLVIAFAQVNRLEDVEVERVLDHAARVARRELEIDDHGILRIVRVDLAVRLADKLFVLPDALERVAAEGRRLLV